MTSAAELAGTFVTTGAQEVARATNATRVLKSPALGLTLEMDPDPVRAQEFIQTKLTVSNQSGSQLSGVTLRARYPSGGVFNVNQDYVTGGVDCSVVTNNSYCDPNELATWNLGTLAAGAGVCDFPAGCCVDNWFVRWFVS